MLLRGTIAGALLLLVGCETTSPTTERVQNIIQIANDTMESMNACYDSLPKELQNNSVFDNILYASSDGYVEELALDRFANDKEKRDIIEFTNLEYKCRASVIEGYGKAHPLFAIAWINYYSEVDNILAKIIKEELTYSEANQQFYEAFQNAMNDSVTAYNTLLSEVAASYAYEEQKRQEAIAALQNWIAVQQLLLNAQRSVVATQPQRSFSYLHCSYAGPNNITCYPY